MSTHSPVAIDRRLLREIAESLSASGATTDISVGVLGNRTFAAQPPALCRQACLAGDPLAAEQRGCPFLAAAARGEVDLSGLRDGRCAQGFRAAAVRAEVGNQPAVLVTVEGRRCEGGPRDDSRTGADLLARLESASRLLRRIGQIVEENEGFANELLQNYEQLNLIFDLTQQIAQVTDTVEIERLLLLRVARLLAAPVVYVLSGDGSSRIYPNGAGGPACPHVLDLPETADAVATVRRTRQALVATLDGRPVVAGALIRLDDRADVVLALGAASRTAFTAGDMMLFESVLSFGGQLISNSELNERLRQMSLEVTRALVAAIDKKDHYTSGHSERVGFLTMLVGKELGLKPSELRIMEWAGVLHDIGKIGIPEEILCKPGKLTPQEFEVIKQHPRMGYDILKPIASFGLILDGVLYHHEQPDGGGYPDGLAGDQVPLVARIIHVADTFDALTSTRSYRKAYDIERAFGIIRDEQDVRLDRTASEALFRALERYRGEKPAEFAAQFGEVRAQENENVVA